LSAPDPSAKHRGPVCIAFVVVANVVITSLIAALMISVAMAWWPSSGLHDLSQTAAEVLAGTETMESYFAAYEAIGTEVAVVGGLACLLVGVLTGYTCPQVSPLWSILAGPALRLWLRHPHVHWFVMPLVWGAVGIAAAWAVGSWRRAKLHRPPDAPTTPRTS